MLEDALSVFEDEQVQGLHSLVAPLDARKQAATPTVTPTPAADAGMSVAGEDVSSQPQMSVAPTTAPVVVQQQQQPMQPQGVPMVDVGQTTTSMLQQDPTAVRKLQNAQADMIAAVMKGGEIGEAKAAAETVIRQQAQADLAKRQEADANKQLLDDQAVEAATVQRRQMLDELSATKKDPDRFWKERGTAARIGGAIAVALGAFGGALTGQRNGALDIINAAIERDLDAQDKEIQIKRDKINAQDNLIGQLERRGATRSQARSIARQHYLESVAMQIETKAAQFGGEQARTNAAAAAAKIRVDAAIEAEHAKRKQINAVKARQPQFTPEQLRKFSEEERERFVPSVGGLAPTKALAGKLIEYDATHADVTGQLSDLIALTKKHGNESIGAISNDMEILHGRIITSMKEVEKLGVLSTGDEKLLRAQVADPTKLFALGPRTVKRLETLLNSLNASRERTFKRYGMID